MPLLASPGKKPQRLKMIEQALKDQAPKTYRQLEKSGKLKAFLDNYDDQMMESYDEADSELLSQVQGPKGPKNYLESVQALQMGQMKIWEETLATWLEFSDPPTTASQTES